MKPPRAHRLTVLATIAVLLAAMTMGNISFCDVYLLGEPGVGPTIPITVKAGKTLHDFRAGYIDENYRFILCNPGTVSGVYVQTERSFGVFTDVNLVTSASTPPGHYTLNYTETSLTTEGPIFNLGILDLTVLPADELTACFYVNSEVILVNSHVDFSAYCSIGPIVLFSWWFDYDGNPTSAPSATTTGYQIQHTYATAGQRTVRLVVRAEGGGEAETSQTVVVQGL